jgi:sigma-B regulation protein RsbU (phosphoserine phosphatase)
MEVAANPLRRLLLWMKARGWLPRTALARVTAYLAAIYAGLFLLRVLGVGMLSGWTTFLGYVVLIFLILLLLRLARQELMWRLRNRLIVTYVFIGVIPLVLLLAMAVLAGYMFIGQFATFLATSDLQAELHGLASANQELASELAGQIDSGVAPERAADIVHASEQVDPETPHSVSFWYAGRQYVVRQARGAATTTTAPPKWLEEQLNKTADHQWAAFTVGDGRLRMRAAHELKAKGNPLIVLSTMTVNSAMLQHVGANLGQLTVYGAGDLDSGKNGKPGFVLDNRAVLGPVAQGGVLPPQRGFLDGEVEFASVLAVRQWPIGEPLRLFMSVQTRKSVLYNRLAANLGAYSGMLVVVLYVVASVFAVIELIALLVGIRLTRTMTGAVSDLYQATQHVNRGDFSHRIRVRSQDQLAALESSFNSMTENIQRLLLDQQEKQRIENELSIAQQVQEQLFPHHAAQLATLDVYGLCRPARTVSGDYYDFLPLGPERLAIAVGDISGKGISAALLMATLHSAVRSFLLLQENTQVNAVPALAAAGASRGVAQSTVAQWETADISPANWLALLNRHLYHSTPAEKYATLFLAAYDGAAHTLTYSNAGHLVPVILGADGGARRLDIGGTVIGLFDETSYDQSTVRLGVGDILVAYSDGITEPESDFGEFGEERLLALIRENSSLPLERIAEEVVIAVKDWIGEYEQPDDMTLVLARAR